MNTFKYFVAIAFLVACAFAFASAEIQDEAEQLKPAVPQEAQAPAESNRQKRFPFAYPGAYPYYGYSAIHTPLAYHAPVAYHAPIATTYSAYHYPLAARAVYHHPLYY